MNFFGIGLPELAVIAAIGLLVFGPKRLPELGKTLGKTLKGFQSASSEFEKEFRSAINTTEVTATAAEAEPKAIAAQPESSVSEPAAGEPSPAESAPADPGKASAASSGDAPQA